MAKTLDRQIIPRARALIADKRNWCWGTLAIDSKGLGVCPTEKTAERRCAYGALIAAAYEITGDSVTAHRLAALSSHQFNGLAALFAANDEGGHDAVMAFFDEVIAELDR